MTLLKNSRMWRVVALVFVGAVLALTRTAVSSAHSDTPTSVTFKMNAASYDYGYGRAAVEFKINGTSVGSLTTSDYNSGDVEQTLTITNPAVLAAMSAAGCNQFSITLTTGYYTYFMESYTTAIINRPSGSETVTIVDNHTSIWNANWEWLYIYDNPYPKVYQTAPIPDTDGDGQNDCSDPDLDGDGVLNGVDNCPAIANTDQANSDSNPLGNACQPMVVAVPWLGSEAQSHQVYSGGELMLQAAAYNPGSGDQTPLVSGTWDPGDGTGAQSIDVSNSLNLELAHTYSGALGQPFTATVSVTDSLGTNYTDTFKVVIAANNRDTKVNMAIDKGLWHLHKVVTRNMSDGKPSGYWTFGGSWPIPSTAGVVQAMEVNNHRESGLSSKDPYVIDVARGLKFLLSSDNGRLMTTPSVGLQGANDPDDNHNGFALYVPDQGHDSYVTGQVVDAIVASGTPNATATVGMPTYVKGRTYKNIVQDMLDGYSWGMGDGTGGWNYSYQDGSNDTSASHWWGIAVLAARTWGLDAPSWVKNIQKNVGLPLMQTYNGTCVSTSPGSANGDSFDGHFGYNNSHNFIWDDGTNVTAAGLVLMNADNLAQTDGRFTCASQFLANRYNNSMGNFYTMYQTTKAMRTAYDTAGANAPMTMLNGSIDWYAGYADYLVNNQSGDGSFSSNGSAIGSGDMPSAWAIIMLSPALFEAAPNAVCSVDSSIVCSSGATCGAAQVGAYATANFSGSQSTPGDNPIASYAWNFQDATTAAGVSASHQFSAIGSFPVKLTVTDTKGNASSATCNVTVTDTALPPLASTGGPYEICANRAGSVVLDGSGSVGRGANIVSYQWDFTTPVNFSAIDSSAETSDQTAFFRGLGVGTHDIGLRISDDSLSHFTTTAYSTVTVLAANDPKCNANPAASDNNYSMAKNTTLTGNVVTDGTPDSDANGDTFTAAVVAGPGQGVLVFNPNGAFTYTPTIGFDGVVTFTYKVTDQFGGASNVATVRITVIPNSPPTAQNDTVTTHSPVTISVLSNDSDPDGDVLSVQIMQGAQHGSVFVNADRTVNYTPFLPLSFPNDSFTYTVNDGHGGFSTATVFVTITNAIPVANNDTVTLGHNQNSIVVAVLTNDSDADGDTVTIGQWAGNVNTHGIITNLGNGTISYTPAPSFFGPTASFTYSVNDGHGGVSNTATVTVNFSNIAPIAVNDAVTTHGVVNIPVLANDSDGDNDPLTVSITQSALHGSLLINPDKTVKYTPFSQGNNFPSDSFNYRIDDGHGATATATVSITLTNQPPTALHKTGTTHGESVVINAIAGATDPDGDTPFVVGCGGFNNTPGLTPHGHCFADQGTGTVTFNPNPGWFGPAETFGYTVCDGRGGCANNTITITYLNQLPVPGHPAFTTSVNTPLALNEAMFLVGSTDADGDDLDLPNAPTPQHGTISDNGQDAGIYTPNPGFIGVDTLTFVVEDNHGGFVTSTATITVTAPTTTTVNAPTVVYGSPSVINVTVGSAASSTPTGTVTVTIGSQSWSAVLNNGVATVTAFLQAGTYPVSASYAGESFFLASNGTGTHVVNPAPTTTVVTCTPSVIFNGAAYEVCSATVTGVNGFSQSLPVTYENNVNVGTATASASYGGSVSMLPSSGSATFAIAQAATGTAINAPTIMVAANGTVTVTVTSGSGTVLGNVSLTVDGGAAMTQALVGGVSVFTVTSPNAGDHALTATYAAQGNFVGSAATGNLHVNPAPTATTLAVSAAPQLSGSAVTFTATVVATAPGTGTPNGIVTFMEGATILGTGTLNAADVATFSTTTLSNGPHTITAVYNGVNNYLTSTSNTVSKLIYSFATGGGTFVIGDKNAVLNASVNFWGSQWEKTNSLTGGASNASFKGFAITPVVPTVGATFTSAPGNSAPPPASVPQYLGIIVTSKVTKSGSNITGTIVKLVIVKVDAGYAGDPGHAGTGTIIYVIQ